MSRRRHPAPSDVRAVADAHGASVCPCGSFLEGGSVLMETRSCILCLIFAVRISGFSVDSRAQESATEDGDVVVINTSEGVELGVFVDYVGGALGVRFVYGEELENKRVELRPSPVEVPKGRLLELLTSLLRVRDLAMVEESPGRSW